MKLLFVAAILLLTNSVFAATATLSWPTVTECYITASTQDANGNAYFRCTNNLKLGKQLYVRLGEFDHRAESPRTITGGTCTYTSIITLGISLSQIAYVNVQCAKVPPAFVKTPPVAETNNTSVIILPDGTWGWR